MPGYSGTPLPKKLGIKTGHRVALVGGPDAMELLGAELPEGVDLRRDLRGSTPFDVIVLFFWRREQLIRRFAAAAKKLTPTGGLWIAWPKKASGVATDLSDEFVRRCGLDQGLVDNKVCAVDDVWSGLRFVVRLKDRPTPGGMS